MLPYDRGFNPPAPVVGVTVLHPSGEARRAVLRAKLDTGADITVIPARTIVQLRIMPHGQIWVRGYDGTHMRRRVYYVRLVVEGDDLPSVRCIAAERGDVLLGRNVLNRFTTTLEGKNLTFDLRDP